MHLTISVTSCILSLRMLPLGLVMTSLQIPVNMELSFNKEKDIACNCPDAPDMFFDLCGGSRIFKRLSLPLTQNLMYCLSKLA